MSRIAPIDCGTCGAPVPLADGDSTHCRHCESVVPIPAAHQQLRRDGEKAREARRSVEQMVRTRLGRSVPLWAPRLYKWTVIPAAVLGTPLALALTQSEYHWFAREWVVIAGLLPFLVSLLPWLVLWAYTKPEAYMGALGLSLRPAPRRPGAEGFDCGVCGAPLSVEPDALAATCDYCQADSWVASTPPLYDSKKEARREGKNLADLVSARAFQSFDVRLLLVVYPTVVLLCCGVMWFLLPGRDVWIRHQYSNSVGGAWARVGDTKNVIDLAATDQHLIAVRDNGEVLVVVDGDWETVARDYRGVASNNERALLVGPRGRAAWLRGVKLSPIETPTEAELNDGWLGSDGSAVVVGAKGLVLMRGAGASDWQKHHLNTGNPMVAAFARSLTDVYVVGGITINRYDGERWQYAMLDGLPLVQDVIADSGGAVVVTADLDDPSRSGKLFKNARDKPDVWTPVEQHKRGYAALAFGNIANDFEEDELWIVGSKGLARSAHRPRKDLRAPCKGPLSTALVTDRKLIVAGRDGVFVHTP